MNRRTFFSTTIAGVSASAFAQSPAGEFRNRQSEMAYRRFGRTGMMISEVVSGGDPISPANYDHLNLALDKGLNYLDMAPAYGRGECEKAYGQLLGGSSAKRNKVFLTTKVSGIGALRNNLYQEIFKGLGPATQQALTKQAEDLARLRGILKPGYFFEYYPGQRNQVAPTYLSNVMARDYGHRVEKTKKLHNFIIESLHGSLQRVGVDHFDTLMCPHGACTPEELDSPEILPAFQQLKKEGKVRFLGVTAHNDPGGVLRKAVAVGHYDVVMCAYNVLIAGYVEPALLEAHSHGVGVIAMKAAHAVATHHKSLQPIPQWRIDKVNRVIAGDMHPARKAYLWALQNECLTAVVSNLWDKTMVEENLALAGKKVDLQPA